MPNEETEPVPGRRYARLTLPVELTARERPLSGVVSIVLVTQAPDAFVAKRVWLPPVLVANGIAMSALPLPSIPSATGPASVPATTGVTTHEPVTFVA